MKIAKQKYKHVKVYHEPKFWTILKSPPSTAWAMKIKSDWGKVYLNAIYGKVGK